MIISKTLLKCDRNQMKKEMKKNYATCKTKINIKEGYIPATTTSIRRSSHKLK